MNRYFLEIEEKIHRIVDELDGTPCPECGCPITTDTRFRRVTWVLSTCECGWFDEFDPLAEDWREQFKRY